VAFPELPNRRGFVVRAAPEPSAGTGETVETAFHLDSTPPAHPAPAGVLAA
jgi:hypothetical protein